MRLRNRLVALEQRAVTGSRRWHRILQWEGQTEEQAIAVYEAKNGPIGPDDGSILRVIIRKPIPAPVQA